jgi:hypothetical protein
VSGRAERLAENESFFRRLNEHVQAVVDEPAGTYREFVCECGDADCTMRVPLTEPEYEEVRADATTFLVAPGHVARDIEVVVRVNDRFAVVRKHGEAGEVAVEEDPRS